MLFADRLTLDKPRKTADGYMAVHARAARAGVYQYLGRELDPEGKTFKADQVINVYRPADEVFDKGSLGSFVGKPITDDHPAKPVTADNWRQLARGTIMGAAKDGEFVGFDLAFLDAATIRAVDSGKRELSNGYACDLSFEDGVAPDGNAYQAVQRNIRGNHVALVDKGRAGTHCRIGDAAACDPIPSDSVRDLLVDARTYSANIDPDKSDRIETGARPEDGESHVATKTITFDGLPLEVTDAAEAAINKLQGQLKDATEAKDTAEASVATLTAEKTTLDAKVTELTQAVADAKPTPAQLRDAAKAYAQVCDKAKALGVKFDDDADQAAIMKAVVDAKIGDAAKDWTAEQVAASFATLTKDAKPVDPLAKGISDSMITVVADGASIRDAALASRNRFNEGN